MKVPYTLFLWTDCVFMLIGCSSTEVCDKVGSGFGRASNLGIAGGFWEGSSKYESVPQLYYGLTLVQSRGHLYGTCFEGGNDVTLYFLENCKIDGNHFEGRWIYPPANLGEMIEGTFEGDSCRLTNYLTEGYSVIDLHRVNKLNRAPNVFQRWPNGMAPKTPSIAGGFWEGSGLYKPSCYYGFTFVESRGHLLGTCFQGNGDRICLYYLDNCVIGDNHFDGRKVYLPSNLTDKIEGDFDGDSCQLVDYGTKDYDVVKLHRVTKLSKTPNVFRVLGEKGP